MRNVTVKGREAEILAEAVKKENLRLEAYRTRNRYVYLFFSPSFSPSFKT
jgi:hypothetical protein